MIQVYCHGTFHPKLLGVGDAFNNEVSIGAERVPGARRGRGEVPSNTFSTCSIALAVSEAGRESANSGK